MSKKLQKGSQYEKFDLDGDGVVSDQELSRSEHIIYIINHINSISYVSSDTRCTS
jgi:hypothetical protein